MDLLVHGERELLSRRLKDFSLAAFEVLEPGRQFVDGWHIDAICDHLEALAGGDIKRLLINIPPRFMKSLLCSVMFPAWIWTSWPEARFLCASYDQKLATRDNRKTRLLVQSDWYRERWGDRFSLMRDQNTLTRFDNDRHGFRLGTSVGGHATGEGGDFLIIDDPHNVKKGDSEVDRKDKWSWFTETWSTRVTDSDARFLVIMQRVHEADISGRIMAELDGWTHLKIPMEFEGESALTTLWEDPRERENELLWPERFNREFVESLKQVMGGYAVAGQFQQRPSPRGGGMFRRDFFGFLPHPPTRRRAVRFWDLAASEDEGDWTVGTLLVLDKFGGYVVEDVIRFRKSPAETQKIIKATAEMDGRSVLIGMEQEPGSAGKIVIANYRKELRDFRFRSERPTGSKVDRAQPVCIAAENGRISLLRATWNSDWLDEITNFPVAAHDDRVDSLSGAYNLLAGKPAARVLSA